MVRRKLWIGTMLALLMIVLTACTHANRETNQNEAQPLLTANENGKQKQPTRVITTIKGDITIPAEPKRVIAQGYLGTFLAFNVKPVGAPKWDIDSPHVKHLTAGIEDIGQIELGSVEKILALNPDLIVTLSDDPVMYEQLSKIAPTVVYPYNTFNDARDEIKTFGELLGKQKEAEAWIAEFNETVKAAKEKIKGIVAKNETVSVMGEFNKEIYVYSFGIWRGVQAIYKHLELTPPPRVQKLIDAKEDFKVISFETIPEFAGDYIFLESGKNGQFQRNGSFWNSLEAVKNNRVFDLDTDYFWPYDPIAIKAQVEKVAELLEKSHKK